MLCFLHNITWLRVLTLCLVLVGPFMIQVTAQSDSGLRAGHPTLLSPHSDPIAYHG